MLPESLNDLWEERERRDQISNSPVQCIFHVPLVVCWSKDIGRRCFIYVLDALDEWPEQPIKAEHFFWECFEL